MDVVGISCRALEAIYREGAEPLVCSDVRSLDSAWMEHRVEVTALPGYRILDRADGHEWSIVLEPILRDTQGITMSTEMHLDRIDGMISQLVHELTRHRLPDFVVYNPPDSHTITPIAFVSALVAHRAERLVQATELASAALAALEQGSLQVSAVSARAVFELGVVCGDIHEKVLDSWRQIHGNRKRIRVEAGSDDSVVYRLLWETRMGSRFYETEQGWPLAKSILTRLDRLAKRVPSAKETYDMLCDTTHPNLEAQALLWRTDYITVGENNAIRFAPGRSNSRVKAYVVESLRLSLMLILPFTRDLWWIAADITNASDMTATAKTEPLGLPTRTGRNDLCSCGESPFLSPPVSRVGLV